MAELPKTYDPKLVESDWYARWLKADAFHADATSSKPPFSIVIPPPNVTGMLTLGHVLNNTIQDILARRARMRGCEVLWLPGMDHAGLATQTAFEKWLRKNENLTRHDLGRDEFIRRVWDWKEKHGGIIIEQLKRLGCSCDWARERFTLDEGYSQAVQRVFVDLYDKGLIYRGRRMINWDPVALTALSDEEVIPTPMKSALFYVRYEFIDKPKEYLEVATTRPETVMADVALAVHPGDERYRNFIGQKVWRPLAREAIPIVADDVIDPKFGTGILKVTPAHDKVDFEIGARHKLPVIDVLTDDARINCPVEPELHGLDRFAGREKAAEILRGRGLLSKTEPHESNVGFSERAGVPIEPRLSEQWFLHYPKTEEALRVVREHLIRFFPAHWEKVYVQWLENIQDWCISRQVWWGHRIPAWHRRLEESLLRQQIQVVTLTGAEIEAPSIRELRRKARAYAERRGIINNSFLNLNTGRTISVRPSSIRHGFSNFGWQNIKLVAGLPDLLRHAVRTATLPHEPYAPEIKAVHVFIAALVLGEDLYRVKFTVKEFLDGKLLYDHQALGSEKKMEPSGKSQGAHSREGKLAHRPALGSTISIAELWSEVKKDGLSLIRVQIDSPGEGWTQDPDTLDTWFSSWLWAFETMDAETRARFYPTSVLVTAADIIFFWVARMIIAGLEFKPGKSQSDEDNIPFRDVFFTGIIRDQQGRKMSKSLGNSPDPLELMAKYGADGLRFGLMRMAPSGQDIRFDEKQIEEGRNFATKLWNVARFRQMHGVSEREPQLFSANLSIYAIEVLARLNETIAAVETSYGEYQFNAVAQRLYDFVWGDFCDWFVEAAKTDIFGGDEATKKSTLATMDHVFSAILRLLHPFMPHLTDELWSRMGFARNEKDFLDFVPVPHPLNLGKESRVETMRSRVRAIYEMVEAGRNLRAETRMSRKASFVLRSDSTWLKEESATIARLLNAAALELDASFQPPSGSSVAATKLGELFLLCEETDQAGERDRLDKEIAKLESDLRVTETKLGNRAFTERAPAAVVEEHRRRGDDLSRRVTQLRQARASLD